MCHRIVQLERKLHALHRQPARRLEVGCGVVHFGVNRLQPPSFKPARRKNAVTFGSGRSGGQDFVAAGLPLLGLGLRSCVGLGLCGWGVHSTQAVLRFNTDDGPQVGDVQLFAFELRGQQGAWLLGHIGTTATDVGRADLPAQVINGVTVALQHQMPTKVVRRGGRQRQQQKGIQAGQCLSGNPQLDVDGGDGGYVGHSAFHIQAGGACIKRSLDGKQHIGLHKTQHVARKCITAEPGTVVLAFEYVAGGVAVVLRRCIGIFRLARGSRVKGTDGNVHVKRRGMVGITQTSLVD